MDTSFTVHKPADVLDLIYEIGEKKLLKVLKLRFASSLFEGNPFSLTVMYERFGYELSIDEGGFAFDYKNSEMNTHIHQNFMKYFEKQCFIEKIKLKTKNKEKRLKFF